MRRARSCRRSRSLDDQRSDESGTTRITARRHRAAAASSWAKSLHSVDSTGALPRVPSPSRSAGLHRDRWRTHQSPRTTGRRPAPRRRRRRASGSGHRTPRESRGSVTPARAATRPWDRSARSGVCLRRPLGKTARAGVTFGLNWLCRRSHPSPTGHICRTRHAGHDHTFPHVRAPSIDLSETLDRGHSKWRQIAQLRTAGSGLRHRTSPELVGPGDTRATRATVTRIRRIRSELGHATHPDHVVRLAGDTLDRSRHQIIRSSDCSRTLRRAFRPTASLTSSTDRQT